METQARRIPPALVWITAGTVIAFCAAGTAAFMGWLPGSKAEVITSSAPPAKSHAATATPRAAPAAPSPAQRVARVCAECGIVESVREIETKGEGSGLGAVGGAVAGGVLGHQVGGGRGQDVMTVVGAVGGAVAGNEVEKRMKSTKSYATTVRFGDGSTRVISQAQAPAWRAGDKVKVVDGIVRSDA
jgi:outer membrane lipoprotein SlyB